MPAPRTKAPRALYPPTASLAPASPRHHRCYARFFQMYSHCVGIGGATMQWVALTKLHLPDKIHLQWNAIRHILAAGHVEYYSLSGGELTTEEWQVIGGRDLLTPSEIETLRKYKGCADRGVRPLVTDASVMAVLLLCAGSSPSCPSVGG